MRLLDAMEEDGGQVQEDQVEEEEKEEGSCSSSSKVESDYISTQKGRGPLGFSVFHFGAASASCGAKKEAQTGSVSRRCLGYRV